MYLSPAFPVIPFISLELKKITEAAGALAYSVGFQ
jgi:hypothetical protein